MKLIYHEQPSGNPAIQDQGSFEGLFFSGVIAGSGPKWASLLPCAVATFFTSQQRQNKQDFYFLCQGISKGGWIHLHWLPFTWSTQGSARPSLQSSQPGSLPAPALALCLPHHLPSLLPKGWREVQQQRHKEALDQGLHSLPSPKSSEAFSCILFTSFPCQTSLDENRVSWKGRKKEIT